MNECSDDAVTKTAAAFDRGDMHDGRTRLLGCVSMQRKEFFQSSVYDNDQFLNRVTDAQSVDAKILVVPIYGANTGHITDFQLNRVPHAATEKSKN